MRETIVDRAYAKTLLPPRKEDGHKGDFGKLLVLGGSVGYTGAPYLAASAAVHSGCGLVYLGVPESIWAVDEHKSRLIKSTDQVLAFWQIYGDFSTDGRIDLCQK